MKIYRPVSTSFITQWFGKEKTSPLVLDMYAELGLLGHNGIDFGCFTGTKIYFNCDTKGIVIGTGVYNDGCKYLKILTQDDVRLYVHRYLHLKDFNVTSGQEVETGDLIAYSDNTGKYSSGEHLHYDLSEVIKSGNRYDYKEPDNGYGGQINPESYFENVWVVDKIKTLEERVAILTKILNLLKLLVGLKNKR